MCTIGNACHRALVIDLASQQRRDVSIYPVFTNHPVFTNQVAFHKDNIVHATTVMTPALLRHFFFMDSLDIPGSQMLHIQRA